jgi:hypothetical protein
LAEAIFALAGALVGVLGTVLVALVGVHGEARHRQRAALRTACTEFAAAVSRVRSIGNDLDEGRRGDDLREQLNRALTDALIGYEQLRITAESRETQEAARYLAHIGWWLAHAAETDAGAYERAKADLRPWLSRLYVAVRTELGVRNAREINECLPPDFLTMRSRAGSRTPDSP